MNPIAIMIVRVLKRLRTAVGYHELGMTEHALRSLDSLKSLATIEPFGIVAVILRYEFVKERGNFLSIAAALESAAAQLPTPERRAIKLTLAVCFGSTSDASRSATSVSFSEGTSADA